MRDFSNLQKEVKALKELVNKQQLPSDIVKTTAPIRTAAEGSSSSHSLSSLFDADQFFDADVDFSTELHVDTIENLFTTLDQILSVDSNENRTTAFELMQSVASKFESNWEFLWRYARATYLYAQTHLNRDEPKRKLLVEQAKALAFQALGLSPENAEVQKWCALTIGTLSDFVGMKQKIEDGYTFKVHIDKALTLKSDDPILFHLRGRWCFGVASLTWMERKVASTLFAQPPTSSYEDALDDFIKAETLKPEWVENTLFIAKCHLAKNDKNSAVDWLKKANQIENVVSSDDLAAKKEVQDLLAKNSS